MPDTNEIEDVAAERAWAAFQLKRYAVAEREARGALARRPDAPRALAVLALVLSAQDRHAEALQAVGGLVRQQPGLAYSHHLHGVVLLNAGHHAEAVRAAEEALRLDPEEAGFWEVLARARLAAGARWEAAQAAWQGLSLAPGDTDLKAVLALAMTQIGHSHEAVATAREAVRLAPEDPFNHLALGVALLYGAKAPEQAAASFREALRLEPNDSHSQEFLRDSLRARNRLFRLLRFPYAAREPGKRRNLLIFFGSSLIFHPLLLPVALLTIGFWLLWLAETAHVFRLGREPANRGLLGPADRPAAVAGTASAASGLLALVAGIAAGAPAVAVSGGVLLALVTPLNEALHHPFRPMRALFFGWTALAVTAAVLSVAGTGAFGAPSAGVAIAFSLLAVWPALIIAPGGGPARGDRTG